MDETLLDAARDVDRAVTAAMECDAPVSEVLYRLRVLHSWLTSRECAFGCEIVDAEGRSWAERCERWHRMVRHAPSRREALRTVRRELEPLTGVECVA